MVDIISLLLLLLIQLVQPVPRKSRCECCTCGKGQHLPGQLESVNWKVDKTAWDSHADESDSHVKLDDSDNDIVHQGNGGDNELTTEEEEGEQRRINGHDANRDYSTRPIPPHLDRSAPDWVSPYISKRQSRSERHCEQCHKSFGSAYALKMHTNAAHSWSSPIPSSTTSIQRPPERAPSPVNTVATPTSTCELCQEVFASKFDLRAHKSAKHSWSIICLDCLTTFAHAQDARRHYEIIHGSSRLSPERTQGMLDTIQAASTATSVIAQYPTHSIHEYYPCAECGMIFGRALDLNQHLSSPYAHGGAHFTMDDFPPLTGVGDGPESVARDLAPISNPPTVWDHEPMPRFTLATTRSPTEANVSISPQATLEPDEEITSGLSTANSRFDFAAAEPTSDGESQNEYTEWVENQDCGVEPAAIVMDDGDQGWPEEAPSIAPEFINDTPSPFMEDEPQPTSSPLQRAKAHVERPPLAIVPPYVRAVLKSGLMDSLSYSDDEYEGAGEGEGEGEKTIVIGGIECQIPSFAYTSTNTKKNDDASITITSAPTMLLSADDDEQQSNTVEEEEIDAWAAAEEVARLTWGDGPKRPTISLDLNAPQNGNRPKPVRQNAKSQRGRGGGGGGGGGTFLTTVQRDNFNAQKKSPWSSSKGKKEKAKPAAAPALQPRFEDDWSELSISISMANASGSGKGGHQLSESELRRRSQLDIIQRQKIVKEQALAAGTEDPFGGW